MRQLQFRLVACIALIACAAQVVSQGPTLKTRTKEERERAYQASRRITINVQVTDDSGKPVTDLDAKDFTILDNHQQRKLALFHVVDGEAMNDATEVVIVLDAVNSNPQALEAEKSGIFKYLAKSHGPLPYPTSFVLWSNGHIKVNGATTDRNAVGRAFVSFTRGVHSNACAPMDHSPAQGTEHGGAVLTGVKGTGDAAASEANCLQVHFKDSVAALDGIAQQQLHIGGRTIVIWVGPGWPLPADAEIQRMTPKEQRSYFEEIVSVLHDLSAAQVTVDAVGPRDAAREAVMATVDLRGLAAGTASPERAGPSGLALEVLAHQTGGQVLASSDDVAADLAALCADGKWYYSLSFNPPPAQNGAELRTLEVKVSKPGTHVRTMTEYYSEP